MTQTLILDLPRSVWMTANHRLHWRSKAERTASVVLLARSAALGLERVERVRLVVSVGYPPGVGRADAENAAPTIKAAIDGIVRAGVLEDDDSTHVLSVTTQRGDRSPMRGIYRLTIQLEEV